MPCQECLCCLCICPDAYARQYLNILNLSGVCLVLCVCRGSKYSEVVPDWLILNSDLYGTLHDCGPLRTQFDDVVVLAVVFFALFSRSIGFQMFGNLKDIPLI